MNHTPAEMITTALILASIFMSVAYISYRRQGKTFVAAFDKSLIWGTGLFVIGSVLGMLVSVA